jgi:hypothetical protein
MTDYYPILTRAIASLGRNSSEAREALYGRAREMLGRKLAELNPPLSRVEIIREMRALEAAIRQVSAEWSHADSASHEDTDFQAHAHLHADTQLEVPRPGPSRPTPESRQSKIVKDAQVPQRAVVGPSDINDVQTGERIRHTGPGEREKRKRGIWRSVARTLENLSGQTRSITTPALGRIRAWHIATGGLILLGFVLLIYIFGLAGLFKYVQVLVLLTSAALVLCIFVFVPMAVRPSSRIPAIYGLVGSSYLFGATTWFMCVVVTMEYWGLGGVILGLLLGVVGIIPLGVLLTVLHTDWSSTGIILFSILITVSSRLLGFGLAESLDTAEDNADARWLLFPRVKKAKAPKRAPAG